MRFKLVSVAAAVAATACAGALAAPRVPERDDVVLEKARPRPAQAVGVAGPATDVRAAVQAATLEVELARRTADPRHLGRAQALLAPWWSASEPPIPILMLRATIRQSLHEFDAARADLLAVLRRDPRNAQAWLTLAVVEQVTGHLDSARERCRALAAFAVPLVAVACEAAVDAASGRAREALDNTTRALAASGRVDPALEAWVLTVQAEAALRAGRPEQAEAAFQAALARDPDDLYARGALADALLDQGRAREALGLVRGRGSSDALLLREALAARASGAPEAEARVTELAARFAAGRARGDRVHLREEARLALALGEARPALELAAENWRVQKEPADARVLMEAALAAGAPARAGEAARFVRASRLEDPRIVSLAREVAR